MLNCTGWEETIDDQTEGDGSTGRQTKSKYIIKLCIYMFMYNWYWLLIGYIVWCKGSHS